MISATPQRVTRQQMTNHLLDLAAEHDVTLRFGTPTGPGAQEARARVHLRNRMVETPIRTRSDYYIGLHEFGHLVRWPTGETLYDEAAAWSWALDNAIAAATPTVLREISSSLFDYVHLGRPIDIARGVLIESDPAELPSWARQEWDDLQARLNLARGVA